MESSFNQSAESEYRIHLLREKKSDPALYERYVRHLGEIAREEHSHFGRGVVLVVDNGRQGFEGYVPAEEADMQFGRQLAHLVENYDPESHWILVALTDGEVVAILMEH